MGQPGLCDERWSDAKKCYGYFPPPVGTRNPRVLGSSEPTPEKTLRRGGTQGGSGSNPPNWIPNRRVQGDPCTRVANNDNISLCPTPRTPCQDRALRALCGAAMRASLGVRTQQLHGDFMELVVSLEITELAATAATAGVFELDLRGTRTCKFTRRGKHLRWY